MPQGGTVTPPLTDSKLTATVAYGLYVYSANIQ